jgi:hypothetical protein
MARVLVFLLMAIYATREGFHGQQLTTTQPPKMTKIQI